MRKRFSLIMAGLILLGALPVLSQESKGKVPYTVQLEATPEAVNRNGERMIHLQFNIKRIGGGSADNIGNEYKILVFENNSKILTIDIPKDKKAKEMSIILAVDTSGSMNEAGTGKWDQAKNATSVFFAKLPKDTEIGLALYNHLVWKTLPDIAQIGQDNFQLTKETDPLKAAIAAVKPGGGTAYFDAVLKAINMLQRDEEVRLKAKAGGDAKKMIGSRGKAIVLLTDGVDLNSSATMEQIIKAATTDRNNDGEREFGIRVYPVGIGKPGKETKITSVLVLDTSGSMLDKARPGEAQSKLDAMKNAAKKFMSTIPSGAGDRVRSSIIQFSDRNRIQMKFVEANFFTNNTVALKGIIDELQAGGETAFIDATYDAVVTLEAESTLNNVDKKAVITLTDGVDNTSRRTAQEVIDRAKEAGIQLYMLGFGKAKELDNVILEKMAKDTGGLYRHVEDEKQLLEIFEELSSSINGNFIDEVALKKLAKATGGKYFPAKDVKELETILQSVSEILQEKRYDVYARSTIQYQPGFLPKFNLKLGRVTAGGGIEIVGPDVVAIGEAKGLILPQMSPVIYLIFLGGFIALIAIPMGLSRRGKTTAPAK